MNEYNTIFYETVNGKMPAKDYVVFFDETKTIVLTNGFVKKDQKTPRKEIELAKGYRDDYYARRESK